MRATCYYPLTKNLWTHCSLLYFHILTFSIFDKSKSGFIHFYLTKNIHGLILDSAISTSVSSKKGITIGACMRCIIQVIDTTRYTWTCYSHFQTISEKIDSKRFISMLGPPWQEQEQQSGLSCSFQSSLPSDKLRQQSPKSKSQKGPLLWSWQIPSPSCSGMQKLFDSMHRLSGHVT